MHSDNSTLEELEMNSNYCFPKDLWLQYIQEELGPLGQPENCSKIHWRAMKFLEGESVERFISKYTLLQTGHWAFPPTWRLCPSWGSEHGSSCWSRRRRLLRWEPAVVVPANSSQTSHFESSAGCAELTLDECWKELNLKDIQLNSLPFIGILSRRQTLLLLLYWH